MALPFEPEPCDALKARYSAAVSVAVDVHAVVRGSDRRPGELRRHVFDWDDGLRLIVSRDVVTPSVIGVHVSASVEDGTPLYRQVKKGVLTRVGFEQLVRARWRRLSGDDQRLKLIGWTVPKGVPHFVAPDPPPVSPRVM